MAGEARRHHPPKKGLVIHTFCLRRWHSVQAERAGVALLLESPGLDSILPIEGGERGEASYVESMRQEKETGWLMENGGKGGRGMD